MKWYVFFWNTILFTQLIIHISHFTPPFFFFFFFFFLRDKKWINIILLKKIFFSMYRYIQTFFLPYGQIHPNFFQPILIFFFFLNPAFRLALEYKIMLSFENSCQPFLIQVASHLAVSSCCFFFALMLLSDP